MKIRTKDGKVFDLDGARKAWGPLGSEAGPLIHALLDALEAALSVRAEQRADWKIGLDAQLLAEMRIEIAGANRMRRTIRQAAGVIEEEQPS
jgi:hypothetical protein